MLGSYKAVVIRWLPQIDMAPSHVASFGATRGTSQIVSSAGGRFVTGASNECNSSANSRWNEHQMACASVREGFSIAGHRTGSYFLTYEPAWTLFVHSHPQGGFMPTYLQLVSYTASRFVITTPWSSPSFRRISRPRRSRSLLRGAADART